MSHARPPADGLLRCTACRKPVPPEAPHGSFCSARCRMVDLGRWLNEEYKVAGESAIAFDEEIGEDLTGPFGSSAWEESGDERDA